MSRTSDSDIDLQKFMPSVEASLRLADHEAAEERIRKAFEDPELQALMAAEGRSVDFTPLPPAPPANGGADSDEAARRAALARNETMAIDPRSIEKVRRMGAAAAGAPSSATPQPVTPSSRADGASAVENAAAPRATSKAASPSATSPKARPAAEPVEKPAVARDQRAGQKLPMWTVWTAGASIAAVVLVLVLARGLGEQREVSATAAATTSPHASAAPTVASAEPLPATAGAAVTNSARIAPSVLPLPDAGDAVPPPTPSSTPSSTPRAPVRPHTSAKPVATDILP